MIFVKYQQHVTPTSSSHQEALTHEQHEYIAKCYTTLHILRSLNWHEHYLNDEENSCKVLTSKADISHLNEEAKAAIKQFLQHLDKHEDRYIMPIIKENRKLNSSEVYITTHLCIYKFIHKIFNINDNLGISTGLLSLGYALSTTVLDNYNLINNLAIFSLSTVNILNFISSTFSSLSLINLKERIQNQLLKAQCPSNILILVPSVLSFFTSSASLLAISNDQLTLAATVTFGSGALFKLGFMRNTIIDKIFDSEFMDFLRVAD